MTDRKVTELADQDVYLETFSSSGETEGWDAVNAPFDVVTELSGKLDIVTQFSWNGAEKMYTDLNPAQTYRFEANVENLNASTTALAYVQYTDETGEWLTLDAITLPAGPYSLSLDVNLPSGITDARVWFTVTDASPSNMGHIEVDNARIVAEDLVCYVPDVVSQSDYYPYGMVLRSESDGDGYRYGFQGQEDDPEVKGEGNSTNYKYRMHDPRVGRFFSVDPLVSSYPFYTPYSFSGNIVLNAVEIEGLEPGVLFESQDAAAENWAMYYGEKAFGDDKEYASAIIKVEEQGDVQFKYTEAIPGGPNQVALPEEISNPETEGVIHNHPVPTPSANAVKLSQDAYKDGFEIKLDNGAEGRENFSGKPDVANEQSDIGVAETYGIDVYLLTPLGKLKVYDPETNTQKTLLTDDLPSDPDATAGEYIIWEKGMGLESLSDKYGNDAVSGILNANKVESVDDLQEGQVVIIPEEEN